MRKKRLELKLWIATTPDGKLIFDSLRFKKYMVSEYLAYRELTHFPIISLVATRKSKVKWLKQV